MQAAQTEALNNYNTLSGYFQNVSNYAQGVGELPYFPDIAGTFSFTQMMSDLFQIAKYQSNYALGSRVSHVVSIQSLLREANIRSQTKGDYSSQQGYIAVNDSNYYAYKAYADVYQFTGNSDRSVTANS